MAAPRMRGFLIGFTLTSALALAPLAPATAFSPSGPGGVAVVPKASVTPKVTTTSTARDVTVTAKARRSAKYRKTIPLTIWRVAPKARAVAKRESGGNCHAVSPTGLYRGKWQMSAGFWAAYGGKRYATRADRATCTEQDRVAYRGWLASWWRPWGA